MRDMAGSHNDDLTSDKSTSGFEILESILSECTRGGSSIRLQGWLKQARQKLAAARDTTTLSRTRRQAAQIEQAYIRASSLVEQILNASGH